MKSQTALVRSDSTVELNSVASVDLHSSVVINPCNSEHNLSLRLNDSLKNLLLDKLGVCRKSCLNRCKELMYSLEELRFIRVLSHNLLHEAIKVLIVNCVIHIMPPFWCFQLCKIGKQKIHILTKCLCRKQRQNLTGKY